VLDSVGQSSPGIRLVLFHISRGFEFLYYPVNAGIEARVARDPEFPLHKGDDVFGSVTGIDGPNRLEGVENGWIDSLPSLLRFSLTGQEGE